MKKSRVFQHIVTLVAIVAVVFAVGGAFAENHGGEHGKMMADEKKDSHHGGEHGMMMADEKKDGHHGEQTAEAHKADPEEKGKAQAECPVMGGKIDKDLYVDQDGERIYMCCAGCREKIEKNFDEYAAKMKAEGIKVTKTPKAQTECPVMGGAIDKDLYVEQDGKRIYVCCKGCVKVVEKDFDKYEKMLADEGVGVEEVE